SEGDALYFAIVLQASDLFAGGHFPHNRSLVRAGAREVSPVGAEGNAQDLSVVPHGAQPLAAKYLPQPGGVVFAGGGHVSPGRAKRDSPHRAFVIHSYDGAIRFWIPVNHIPNPGSVVCARRRDVPSAGTECNSQEWLVMFGHNV